MPALIAVPATVNVRWRQFLKRTMPAGSIRLNARIAGPAWELARQKLLSPAKQRHCALFLALVFLCALCGKAGAQDVPSPEAPSQDGPFPVIARLDAKDPIFKQYLADVELARRRLRQHQDKEQLAEILQIYVYSSGEDEDIFRLAARCNVPQSALATLNRVSHPSLFKGGVVLLPSVPGIFLPETPKSDFEQLLAVGREQEDGIAITVPGQGRFLFLPGADFYPTERVFFLNSGFHFPLRNYRISSPYGMRPNPFNGKPQKHNGMDLAAPTGTEVYPARAGRVAEMGNDPVFGNYIIIAHEDNWASLYGHLSSFSTTRGTNVTRNTVIGKVGSTGQSTGPHLHFELRKNGTALDPGRLLFKNSP